LRAATSLQASLRAGARLGHETVAALETGRTRKARFIRCRACRARLRRVDDGVVGSTAKTVEYARAPSIRVPIGR